MTPNVAAPSQPTNVLAATPQLADPGQFKIELFADFKQFGRLKTFHLVLTAGEAGYPKGMYVTSGPTGDDRSDRLIRMDGPNHASIVQGGLVSNEGMVFAKGPYGTGILLAEPRTNRILRITPGQQPSIFASLGTAPFGPAGMAYGPDGQLYVADYSGGVVLKVSPSGQSAPFAEVIGLPKPVAMPFAPVAGPPQAPIVSGGLKAIGFRGPSAAPTTPFMFASTFTAVTKPMGLGQLIEISADGQVAGTRTLGIDGVGFPAYGPGGPFGSDLYVPSSGGAAHADGGIYTLDPASFAGLKPFLTGLDAIAVVFDTAGILGGGMFVSDINDNEGAGKIWHITPAR